MRVRRGSCPLPPGPSAWRASPAGWAGRAKLRSCRRLGSVSLLRDPGTTTLVQQQSLHQAWGKRIIFSACPVSRSCCPERNFSGNIPASEGPPGKVTRRITIRSQPLFVTRTRWFGLQWAVFPLDSPLM
uniref:Uncharacterized protein n=1 Tax=Colobus angolensis palliatus TaxID=336983 RepID=A0A2K5J126_COLAP